MKARAIVLCFVADAIIAGADVLAKKWVQGGGSLLGQGAVFFWTAWALYAGVSGLWFVLLKSLGDLGRSSVVWSATGVIAGLVIGMFMGERPSPINWIGVALAAAGVVLTSLK